MARRPVPVTLITGALGTGKTTAILDAFRRLRPPGERWAVLVNEFGEVGIDGAILGDADGLEVEEIPGGCICCTAGPMLGRSLSTLLERADPDRLLIEPTGLASPAQIIDLIRRPWFEGALALRAVITLVDPRRYVRPDTVLQEVELAQVEAADVLVANRADQADEATRRAFHDKAAALWPPKAVVAQTSFGRLQASWLDRAPAPDREARVVVHERAHEHEHEHEHEHDDEHGHAPAPAYPRAHVSDGVATAGWVFPPDVVFDPDRLQTLLHGLMQPNALLPAGVLRLKGVFHAGNAWGLVQGAGESLRFGPSQHRRDSRVELIVPAEPAPDWDGVSAQWRKAQRAQG